MKKFIAIFIVMPFMALAQNLQITKITLDPAPQCPTATNPNPTTTVSVTVVGGTAPYTFSSEFPVVTPTVSGNTATFVFPVIDSYALINVSDSSSPALTTSFQVSLFAALFSRATWTFLSPCAGRNNGSITISVTGEPAANFDLYDISNDDDNFVTATSNSYTFTNLAVASYEVTAYSNDFADCSDEGNFVDVYDVKLNAFENSYITSVADYVQRAYCQNCFNR